MFRVSYFHIHTLIPLEYLYEWLLRQNLHTTDFSKKQHTTVKEQYKGSLMYGLESMLGQINRKNGNKNWKSKSKYQKVQMYLMVQ